MTTPVHKDIKIQRYKSKGTLSQNMISIIYKGIEYHGPTVYHVGMVFIKTMQLDNRTNIQKEVIEFLDYCNVREIIIRKVSK